MAAKCDDQALQNQVIVSAKQTALATQALIACTKVLAPCIDSPLCQEQLIESCKMVAAAVEKIVLAAQVRTMSPYMEVSKHVCYICMEGLVHAIYGSFSTHLPYMEVLAHTCHIWKSNTLSPYMEVLAHTLAIYGSLIPSRHILYVYEILDNVH